MEESTAFIKARRKKCRKNGQLRKAVDKALRKIEETPTRGELKPSPATNITSPFDDAVRTVRDENAHTTCVIYAVKIMRQRYQIVYAHLPDEDQIHLLLMGTHKDVFGGSLRV